MQDYLDDLIVWLFNIQTSMNISDKKVRTFNIAFFMFWFDRFYISIWHKQHLSYIVQL